MKIKDFPKVDNTYYGGNQAWMKEKKHAAGGCGIVAAANLVHYYRKRTAPSAAQFLNTTEALYHWLAPVHLYNPFSEENTFGLPFFGTYMKRLQAYFKAIGLDKDYVVLHKASFDKVKQFVKQALEAGDPVIVLLIGHRRLKAYNNHYMTITGYEDAEPFTVHFSTWGEERTIALREFYDHVTIFRLGRFK